MLRQCILACALSVLAINSQASDYEKELEASRATAQAFMQSLKQELTAAMQAGGPINAVSVCNLTAPGIANTYSARHGWDVGRTSLRLRNPANAADAWERAVLESFAAQRADGAEAATLEFHEVVVNGERRELRYMKAIPTGDACLACHGEQLDGMVRARIDLLYPHDQATGYRPGDVRGAFTITQPLPAQDTTATGDSP